MDKNNNLKPNLGLKEKYKKYKTNKKSGAENRRNNNKRKFRGEGENCFLKNKIFYF